MGVLIPWVLYDWYCLLFYFYLSPKVNCVIDDFSTKTSHHSLLHLKENETVRRLASEYSGIGTSLISCHETSFKRYKFQMGKKACSVGSCY